MTTGLANTATITINLEYNGGKGVAALTRALSGLSNAMQSEESLRRMQEMETALNEQRQAVVKLEGELQQAQESYAALQESVRKNSAASRAASNAAAAASAKESKAAEQRAQQEAEATALLKQRGALTVGIYHRSEQGLAQLAAREEAAQNGLVAGWKQMVAGAKTYSAVQKDALSDKATKGLIAGWKQMMANVNAAAEKEKEAQALLKQRAALTVGIYRRSAAGQAQLAAREEQAQKGLIAGYNTLMAKAKTFSSASQNAMDTRATKGLVNGWMQLTQAIAKAKNKEQEAKEATALHAKLMSMLVGKSRDFQKQNAGLIASIRNSGKASYDQLANLGHQLDVVIDKENELNRAMKGQYGVLDGLKTRLTHYEQQMDAIFRASFRMQMVGNNLMMFARDIVRWGTDIMNVFGEFEYNMNRAAGSLSIWQSSTTANQVGTDALTAGLVDLAEGMRLLPAKDIAEAMYFWGSTTGEVVNTQADLNKQMAALEPIMKAAVMTNTDYETTIKGVYSILSQYYNGEVSHAADVTEMLFLATQKTAAEFPDLINSFKMVGPVAKQNGDTFEEMVAVFGRLADLGIRGTMAGRGLRQLYLQAVRPSGPAMGQLNEVFSKTTAFGGRSYKDIMFEGGEFVGVEKYVRNLAIALKDADQAYRNLTIRSITTANEAPILTALVVEQINAMKGLATQTKKTATTQQEASENFRKSWERLSGSWKGVIGTLQRVIEAVKIQLGAAFAQALDPLIKKLVEVIDKVKLWVRQNPEIVKMIGTIAGLAAAVAAAAGAVLTLVGSLMGIAAVAYVVVRAFSPLKVLIVGITGGLIAFADAIVENFDYIQSKVEEAGQTINETFKGTGDVMNNLGDALNTFMQPLKALFGLIVRLGADAIAHLSRLVQVLVRLNDATHGAAFRVILTFLGVLVAGKTILGIAALTSKIIAMVKAFKLVSMLNVSMTGITLLMEAFGAARMAAAAAGAGKLMSILAGVRAAVSGLATLVGPLGIVGLVLGAGYIAYENNILGFRDLIDGLTGNFRDLRNEVKEANKEFGRFGDALSKLELDIGDKISGAYALQQQVNAGLNKSGTTSTRCLTSQSLGTRCCTTLSRPRRRAQR
jgi:TP901 family phage tail tape measure protein